MQDARYFDIPEGAILAMPSEDYAPPEQEFEFDLVEHFENAQAMSNDNDLGMER